MDPLGLTTKTVAQDEVRAFASALVLRSRAKRGP